MGGVQSAQDQKASRDMLAAKSRGRMDNNLGSSYNAMLAYGGHTGGDAVELNRIKSMSLQDYRGHSGMMSPTSRVRTAGSYLQQGGRSMPMLQNGDNGVADAEIEGGEAVLGNPNSVTMYGGADAKHASPAGFIAQGAKHGQTNNGGSEGIPLHSDEELYIGSDKLALDG